MENILLLVVRHGETLYNKLGLYQGSLDSELTEIGIEQVNNIKKHLARFELDNFTIVSSPSWRCIKTAQLITNKERVINTSALLAEQRFGLWEGQETTTIKKRFEGIPLEDFNFYTPPLGESYEQAKLRAKQWLHFNFLKNPEIDYLIVTHKKISMAIRQLLVPNRSHLDHPHASLYEIDIVKPYFFEHLILGD